MWGLLTLILFLVKVDSNHFEGNQLTKKSMGDVCVTWFDIMCFST